MTASAVAAMAALVFSKDRLNGLTEPAASAAAT
jgi:hypothetical protein